MYVVFVKKMPGTGVFDIPTPDGVVMVSRYPVRVKANDDEDGRSSTDIDNAPWFLDNEREAQSLAKQLAAMHLNHIFCVAEMKYEYQCQPKPVSGARYTDFGVVPL